MARYIDADKIDLNKYPIGRSLATDWIDIEDVKRAIALTPTADVVPKSEVDWNSIPVDVSEALKQRAVEKAKAEVAREIFEEIDKRLNEITIVAHKEIAYGDFCGTVRQVFDAVGSVLAELKKKYVAELKKKYVKDCRNCIYFAGCEAAAVADPATDSRPKRRYKE